MLCASDMLLVDCLSGLSHLVLIISYSKNSYCLVPLRRKTALYYIILYYSLKIELKFQTHEN